jgi:hypothetical protein
MKKVSQVFGFLLMLALFGVSCVKESATPPELSKTTIEQLDKSMQNWNDHLGSTIRMIGYKPSGTIENEGERNTIIASLSSGSAHTAYGNILEVSSIHFETIGSVTIQNPNGIQLFKTAMDTQIHVGDRVVDIIWEKNGSRFTQKCLTNDAGIAWDNILFGVWMMDLQPFEETKDITNNLVAVSSKWYKAWQDVNWLWGTRRGQMGYQITIYFSGKTVSSTDPNTWAYMNIGSAVAERKVIKNSGTYGQIQYAIGLATPLASVSFKLSSFSATVSGLGSNTVSNGTQSLYP